MRTSICTKNGRVRNARVYKPYEQVTSDKMQPFTSCRKGSLLLVTVDKEELFSTEKSLKAIYLGKFSSLISTPFAFHLDPCFLADAARHLQSVVALQCTETAHWWNTVALLLQRAWWASLGL